MMCNLAFRVTIKSWIPINAGILLCCSPQQDLADKIHVTFHRTMEFRGRAPPGAKVPWNDELGLSARKGQEHEFARRDSERTDTRW